MTEHIILGIMSGSSLDGLDLAICRFQLEEGDVFAVAGWDILAAETDPYPPTWRARLRSAPALPGRELWRLHADLGRWIGQRARVFLDKHPAHAPTLVGSHGHTIFHEPDRSFTTQIGDGAAIAEVLRLPTATEFRGSDVAAGGQGAPLAPLADKYLFPDYSAFLNLGGIANLSVRRDDGDFLAGDISGCCQIMDKLAAREGLPYDDGGRLAAGGSLAPAFAPLLDALPYHSLPYPKSLGNAWVRETLWPLVNNESMPTADCLRSFVQWLAEKIAKDLDEVGAAAGATEGQNSRVLVTGGGARNTYLLDRLRASQNPNHPNWFFVSPDPTIADFKEAALMALCALLRKQGQANALPSATGARRPTVNGALYWA